MNDQGSSSTHDTGRKTAAKMPDFSVLKGLGLAKTDIASYRALCLEGPQTAGSLAKSLKKPRASVYHALEQLELSGFVERTKVEIFHQATRFRAVRLDKALENLAIYQRRAVHQASGKPEVTDRT